MLAGVIPGLRELRAPLAAGFLWLSVAWVVWGHAVPTADEVHGPLAQLYELEPVVSDLGRAVVASVVAYVLGSLAIDVQARMGEPAHSMYVAWQAERSTAAVGADAPWFLPVRLPATDAGRRVLFALVDAGDFGPTSSDTEVLTLGFRVEAWIQDNREVIKTRLLDLSPLLHSEVDRPDAEATFRMALWPPLLALTGYLTLHDPWWALAIAAPLLLAWQWISLRRQANDALVTAIATRRDLLDLVSEGVARAREQEEAQQRAAERHRGHA